MFFLTQGKILCQRLPTLKQATKTKGFDPEYVTTLGMFNLTVCTGLSTNHKDPSPLYVQLSLTFIFALWK